VTSVTRLRAYRRAIVACFVFRQEIGRKSVWDFFDSIGQTEKNSVRAYVFRFARTRTLLDAFGMSQRGPLTEVTPMLARGSKRISYCRPDRENMPHSNWGDSAAGAQASLQTGHPFRVRPHSNDQLSHELRRGRPSCLRCPHWPADDRTEAQ
jgi:hypothetical protein